MERISTKPNHQPFIYRRLMTLCLMVFCISPARSQKPLFELLSFKETGVSFNNNLNETENLNVMAYEYFYNGGGVAVGDINNDGLPDLYFSANMKSNKLYLNKGGMKFQDITRSAGVEGRAAGWKTGVTMADVNGDGLLDIYLCYSGKHPDKLRANQLFINRGNLVFEDQAKSFGLDDISYSTQASFFDFDKDGDLDLFLLNHNVKKFDNMELAKFRQETSPLASNKLFENKGNVFVDISARAGIYQNPLTFGLGVAVADIDKDGWQDIYVTNDYNEPDYLYMNNGNGTFTDRSKTSLRHISHFSMGVDIADFNNDNLPDIFTLDMLPADNRRQKLLQLQENYESFQLMVDQDLHKQFMRNMLQLNNGDGTYSEIGQLAGVSNTDWSWCPLFADFDNDGYKDLFVTTGYLRDYTNKDFLRYWGDYKIKKAMDREPMLMMDLVRAMPSTPFYNFIFQNNGNLTFSNRQKDWGLMQDKISSAAIYADLDNDGDLDLAVNNINEDAFIYRNNATAQSGNNFLAIKLSGKSKDAGNGSRVNVYSGGMVQYQEVNQNRGYLSCVSTTLNFGLGKSAIVDSVRITWPDNTTTILKAVQANQLLNVQYQAATLPVQAVTNAGKEMDADQKQGEAYFRKVSDPVNYKHTDFSGNDFKRQPLMMFMYSKTGPVMAKADVDNDGLEDLYISGDMNNPGFVYRQDVSGRFLKTDTMGLGNEAESCISAARFFDANGDGFNDLYLARGGYGLFEPNTLALQDELYLNNGKGQFSLSRGALPNMSASCKSVVRACDFDNDGDQDLFIGGRIVPGQYPATPQSFLLRNNGKGMFIQVTTAFDKAGMITDAAWTDLDKDGRKDLVICGEFMPVSVFLNTKEGFVNDTKRYFTDPISGFWFSLTLADLDGDGEEDIVAGNLGSNTQIKVKAGEPAEMFFADFDQNGSIDPFLNFYVGGKTYPFVSRDELNDQIYPMRKKFGSYKDYAEATMPDLFPDSILKKATRLSVTGTNTTCYLKRNGRFEKVVLPVQAQFSMVTKIMVDDFTGDGKKDILLLGNHSDNRLKIGSIDANYGCLLAGNGQGRFDYVDQKVAGLSVTGDVKSVELLKTGNKRRLIISSANEKLQSYEIK
jgi:hypothetical protein